MSRDRNVYEVRGQELLRVILPTTGETMEDAREVIEAVKRIMKEVNFPTRLRNIKVDEKNIPKIVEDCIDRSDMANNPRKFGSKEARKFLESIA